MGNNVNLYKSFFLEWWEIYIHLFMEKLNTLLWTTKADFIATLQY